MGAGKKVVSVGPQQTAKEVPSGTWTQRQKCPRDCLAPGVSPDYFTFHPCHTYTEVPSQDLRHTPRGNIILYKRKKEKIQWSILDRPVYCLFCHPQLEDPVGFPDRTAPTLPGFTRRVLRGLPHSPPFGRLQDTEWAANRFRFSIGSDFANLGTGKMGIFRKNQPYSYPLPVNLGYYSR